MQFQFHSAVCIDVCLATRTRSLVSHILMKCCANWHLVNLNCLYYQWSQQSIQRSLTHFVTIIITHNCNCFIGHFGLLWNYNSCYASTKFRAQPENWTDATAMYITVANLALIWQKGWLNLIKFGLATLNTECMIIIIICVWKWQLRAVNQCNSHIALVKQ